MFYDLYPRRQTRLIIAGRHCDARLDHRRAAIELIGDEMHGGAVLRFMRFQNAPVCVQARRI